MRSQYFDFKDKNNDISQPATALTLFLVLLFVVVHILSKAFVLCLLWEWYLVAYFNIAPLTMPVAFGLCILGQLFTGLRQELKTQRDVLVWLIAPFFTLFFGWAGTFFM
jgi:hypothetical protein